MQPAVLPPPAGGAHLDRDRVVPFVGRPSSRSGRSELTAALLQVDAALRAAVPAEDRPIAERVVTAIRRDVPAGRWVPDRMLDGGRAPFAALLLRGVMVQEVLLAGRASAQLIGPGDVFRPWTAADTALPDSMRWTCAQDAAIALLDERFLTAARRWPRLFTVVQDRLSDQLDDAVRRTAVCGLPRVEDRVLAFFWQLADRWGIVRPEGVVIRLSLTHELIGRLVAAKRPTVSLALSTLAVDGLLARDAVGAWTLAHTSLDTLDRGAGRPRVAAASPAA
jgi:CRP/FNR family transcriptional regulator, cyclic AMP receptor protein